MTSNNVSEDFNDPLTIESAAEEFGLLDERRQQTVEKSKTGFFNFAILVECVFSFIKSITNTIWSTTLRIHDGTSKEQISLVIETPEETPEELAWNEGQRLIYDLKYREKYNQLTEMVSISVKGLLSLAEEVPFVGPVAGILLSFYERYQNLSKNKEDFKDLRDAVDMAAAVFLDQRVRNLMRASQSDKIIIAYFKQFTKSVFEINALMKAIEGRIASKGVVANAKNFIMSDQDKERIQAVITKSKNTRKDIIAILTAKPVLDENSNSGLLSRVYECLLRPGTFDDIAEVHQKKFQKGSRSWIFHDVNVWFDDSEIVPATSKSVFWLQARAGMGKTVFTSELVRRFKAERPGALLGVVFFNFKGESTQGPTTLLKSIVYQIAKSYPSICCELLEVLKEINDTTVEGIFDRMLLKALELVALTKPTQKHHLIIFDALDECGFEGTTARRDLLQLFQRQFLRKLPATVKLFVTGQSEKDIDKTLSEYAHTIKETDLGHLEDLNVYIRCSVQDIFDRLTEDASATISIQNAADLIFEKSEGNFVYAAVVVDQMNEWFKGDLSLADFQANLKNLPQGLDSCYQKTFEKFIRSNPIYGRSFLLLMVGCRERLNEAVVMELISTTSAEEEVAFTLLIESTATIFPLVVGLGEHAAKFVPYHKSIVEWLTSNKRNKSELTYFDLKVADWFMADKLLRKVGISFQGNPVNFKDVLTANALEHLGISFLIEMKTLDVSTLLYAVRHLTSHLNNCQLGLLTYFLMTNLTWLQLSLEAMGLVNLIESYWKLLQSDEWLPRSCRSDLMKDVKLMSQFLKLLAMTKFDDAMNWRREICTQITARLAKTAASTTRSSGSRISRLVEEAQTYFRTHGGWRFGLRPPGDRGSDDKTIKIWNTETGQRDLTL